MKIDKILQGLEILYKIFNYFTTRDKMKDYRYLIIHSSATKPSMDVPVERIEKWHLKRGWSGIGYHVYITRDGNVHLGRDLDKDGSSLDEQGAHTLGLNRKSWALCYEGGMNEEGKAEDTRTPEQLIAMKAVIMMFQNVKPGLKIRGHRDYNQTSCPSFDVKEWCNTVGIEHN